MQDTLERSNSESSGDSCAIAAAGPGEGTSSFNLRFAILAQVARDGKLVSPVQVVGEFKLVLLNPKWNPVKVKVNLICLQSFFPPKNLIDLFAYQINF